MNEDPCLCFYQGATLRLIKDTAYFFRVGTNNYHLKKLLPLHSNISDWSITGRSISAFHIAIWLSMVRGGVLMSMGYSFLFPE